MEYTETNKLIAEFMGAYSEPLYCGIDGSSRIIYRFPDKSFDDYISDFEDETPYHTDWNWLMPVVEKVSSMVYFDHFPFSFQDFLNARGKVDSLPIATPLEEVYKAIVQFINWYNSIS